MNKADIQQILAQGAIVPTNPPNDALRHKLGDPEKATKPKLAGLQSQISELLSNIDEFLIPK